MEFRHPQGGKHLLAGLDLLRVKQRLHHAVWAVLS